MPLLEADDVCLCKRMKNESDLGCQYPSLHSLPFVSLDARRKIVENDPSQEMARKVHKELS